MNDTCQDEELTQGLMKPTSTTTKKEEGIVQRLMLKIDERVSVKLLMLVWGPRVEFFVRLMLVATFLDDSLRTATHFSSHAKEIGGEQGFLPSETLATILLGIGLITQCFGSISVLALFHADLATMALIGWAIAQPVLYSELSNIEFLAESCSIIGGLLMLHAKYSSGGSSSSSNTNTQLFGRLMLPTVYLYQAGLFLYSATTLDETSSIFNYVSSLSLFAVNVAMLVGLVISACLVSAGLKSRTIALLLSIANLVVVFYQHPFFTYISRKNGEWQYGHMSVLSLPLPSSVIIGDLEPFQIYDLHRYYFFMGLSTSGALLMLAQFGPGEIAIQKDELILPTVARAQD